ncbi:MAG: hypothetical protein V4714_11185 [Bacteroidota bacterium]
MDDLKTAIDTLSEEDRKEFAQFIRRQKNKKNRKDLDLFKLLQLKQSLSSAEMIARLYPDEANPVAYYAVRKRLMRHLTDFILLKRTQQDNTAASSLMGMISLAQYLFAARAERIAWNILRKAEKVGLENEQYDFLNSLYNLQIAQASSEYADELTTILEKRNQNKRLADEDERANIASSLIKHRLAEVRRQGRGEGLDFERVIREVLETYQLSDAINRRPSLLYKLMSIARSAVLVGKDFYTFEPYIREQYHRMETSPGFAVAHQYYQQSLLYMIAQALYRNRKFTESIHYLELLRQCVNKQKSYYQEFHPRYVLLLAVNQAFLGKNEQSVMLLESLLNDTSLRLTHADRLNALLNLSFYYFQQCNYKKANQTLMEMHHSDAWCEQKMGREWMLKKSLSELILQYELGNVDLALNKMRAIERSFGELLRQKPYQNVRSYLQLVKQMLDQPAHVSRPDFFRQVDDSIDFAPLEQEDIQAMNFYAWLKSKMVRQDYYEVLLEMAGR